MSRPRNVRIFCVGARLLVAWSILAGMTQEILRLTPDMPLQREIAAGESQRIQLSAEAGQFLQVTVEQRGIDLVVGLTDPEGKRLTEVNNPGGTAVPEAISLIADLSGTYVLDIASASPGVPAGSYLVRMSEPRAASPADRARITAERAEATADRQFDQRTADSLRQARSGYIRARDLWRDVGDRGKEGEMFYRVGVVERLLGQPHEALSSFGQALKIQQQGGNRRAEASTLNQMGLAQWALSENGQALSNLEASLTIWHSLGETEPAARVLNNLGVLYRSLGQLRKAAGAYQEALAVFQQSADRVREATALNNLGEVYKTLGEPLTALPLHERALSISRAIADRATEAESLNNLGLLESQVGDGQKALERFVEAEKIYQQIGDRPRQAIARNNLSSQYADLGEDERALDLLLQALPLQRQTGDRRGEAATLYNLGRRYSALGRAEEAVKAFEQALAIQQEIKDAAGEAATLGSLGFHYSTTEPGKALELLSRSLALMVGLGDRAGEARTEYRSGLAQAALGEPAEALSLFQRSLSLFRGVGDAAGEVATLQEIARTEMARGNLEAARAALEPALEKVESLRLRISVDRLRSSYFASLRDAYELEIALLMSLHDRQPAAGFDAMAFQTAERARARSLLDLLREARVEIRHGADPALLEEERRLRVGLDAKAERLTRVLSGKPAPEQAAEARRELAEAETAYELAEGRLRAALPAYGNLVHPEPVKLADIQAMLDGDTVLLEIALGEKRSFLWKVTPTSLASFELPPRAVIEAAAREAYAALSVPNAQEGARRREPLDRLGRMLFGPLAGELHAKRLAVVAGEALQYVPFAALSLPTGEPVVERYEVVSLPSAAVLGELRRKAAGRPPAPGMLAVLADPVFGADDPRVRKAGPAVAAEPRSEETPRGADLERAARDAGAGAFPRLSWTRREAELATAQAGGRQVLAALDFQASRETATGPDLARYRVVHFATHGLLDSRHPEISGLVLSLVDEQGRPRDGFLRLPDIYNLDLGAELVVLSGCQTALGREVRGEGLMGMSRGFFYAGASEVLASLWAVRDRATAELMQRFYHAMFQQGLGPAAALRAAQLSMRREPRWRDPYFWAAFNLQGDWRSASPGPAGTR